MTCGPMSLACVLNYLPSSGVFVAPEFCFSGTAATEIYTSIALYPDPTRRSWSNGVAGGIAETHVYPLRHVSLNLGAPGFREDADGNLWIPYPTRTGTGMIGDWLPTYQHNQGMCYQLDDLRNQIVGTNRPWLFTSGYGHTKPLRFRLVEEGGTPARSNGSGSAVTLESPSESTRTPVRPASVRSLSI